MFLFLAGLAFGAEKSFVAEEHPTVDDKPRRRRHKARRRVMDMPLRRALNSTSFPEELSMDMPRRRVPEVGWNNCGRNEQFNDLGRGFCTHNNHCEGERRCSNGMCTGDSNCPHCGKTQKMNCKDDCPGDGWDNYRTTNHGCCSSWLSCGGNMKHCKWDHPQACGRLSAGTIWVNTVVDVKIWGNEMSFNLAGDCHNAPGGRRWANNSQQSKRCRITRRSYYKIICKDSYGDGWHGGSVVVNGKRLCQNFKTGRSYEQTFTL